MYLEFDENFPEHPKSVRLCSSLQNPVAWAYMAKLWCWARKYQKDGDLTGYEPAEIEFAVGWTLADGRFYAAATRAGFIDEDHDAAGAVVARRLHNWMKRSGGAIKRMEDEAGRKRAFRLHAQRKCDAATCPNCAASTDGDGASAGQEPDAHGLSGGRPTDGADQDKTNQDKSKQDKSQIEKSEGSEGRKAAGAQAASPPVAPPAPAILKLPCMPGKAKGPTEWPLTDNEVAVLSDAFPGVDIVAAARRANAWLIANPGRRKTYAGMLEALRRWIARDVDRGITGVVPIGQARGSPPQATGYSPVRGGKDYSAGSELFAKG